METPPELPPPPRPPLGKSFVVLLLAPVAGMCLAALLAPMAIRNGPSDGLGIGLALLILPVMLVCSILCAVRVGRRNGGGMGFLAFVGIQIFYLAVAFAGCAAAISRVDFR